MQRLLLLFSLFLTFSTAEVMPTDRRVLSGVLPNGLHYIIMHNKHPAKMAEFRLVVKAGSLDEEDDQRGIAHFVEHMAFNGSKHFEKNEMINYLESIGLRFGGDLNANTNFENTIYKLSVPANRSNIDKTLLILHDWADGISFDAQEFDKERGVVLEEKRLRNTPAYRILNQFSPLIYGNSKYTHRDVIGTEDILKHIPVQRAVDFYHKWYRPDAMTLIIVGDIEPKLMESKIKNSFSDITNSNHTKYASRLIPDNNTIRIANVTDKELASNSVEIYYLKHQSGAVTTSDRKTQLIDWIIRLMFNHNADNYILNSKTKLLSLSMRQEWITSLRKADIFHTDFSSKDKKEAFIELNHVISRYANFGFKEKTLKTAVKELIALNDNNHKERDSITSSAFASRIVNNLLDSGVFVDDEYDYNLSKKLLKSIKLSEINSRYKETVSNRDKVIVFMANDNNKVSLKNAQKWIEEGKKRAKVKAVQNDITLKLPPHPEKCAKIKEKSLDKKYGIYHYILENNISIDFKPTKLKKNEVLLSAISPGGDSVVPVEDLDNLHKAARWVVSSLPGKLNNDEIETILASTKLSYHFGIERYYETISGVSSSSDFETLMHLLYLQITEPKIDENVARQLKRIFMAQITGMQRNPGYRFEKAVSNFYYKNNPRIIFDTDKSIEKLDTKRMLTLFKQKFSDMNHFHFIIIGDISVEQVEKLISCYLGNLPTSPKREHYDPNPYPYRHGEQHFIRAYNSSNIANINMQYRTTLPYSVHNAAVINAIQSILSIRLRQQIREEKSGTYAIGISCNLIREMKDTLLCNIVFATDPNRKDKLIKDVKQSISEFVKYGPSSKELTEMKKEFSMAFAQMKQMNNYWLTIMQLAVKYNTPLEAYLKMEDEVNSITVKEVKMTAKKIFSGDLLVSERIPQQQRLKK